MASMIFTLLLKLIVVSTPNDLNFGSSAAGQDWRAVNDGVMGGRSQGVLQLKEEGLHFTGNISLENNGGFASIRSTEQEWDLSGVDTISLKYRNSGLPFALSLYDSRLFYEPNYRYSLPLTGGDWNVIHLPLDDFRQYRLGRPTGGDFPAAVRSEIIRLGFINAGQEPGTFLLEVSYIHFR